MPVATRDGRAAATTRPGMRVSSCGLRACGEVTPRAYSWVETLPRITAPASRNRGDRPGVLLGHTLIGDRIRNASSRPATWITSLTEIGIPCSGPRTVPPARSASRAAAVASAASAVSSTNATSRSLSRATASSACCVSSTAGESRRPPSPPARRRSSRSAPRRPAGRRSPARARCRSDTTLVVVEFPRRRR